MRKQDRATTKCFVKISQLFHYTYIFLLHQDDHTMLEAHCWEYTEEILITT